jgi:glutathionyl-hydroquinone reductase
MAQSDYVSTAGEFTRDSRYIATRITADGRDGYPVEPGRYRLVVSRACPWASRAVVVRRLLGLEHVLSMGICGPTHDERSWTFDLDPGGRDPVLGIERLQEAYLARFPDYDKGVTVPAMVDVPTGQVVTNDFPTITRDLFFEWRPYHRDGAPDLWPAAARAELEEVMDRVYTELNNGVYRCGFASSQEAYDSAYERLFDTLDWLSDRLVDRRYLLGDTITEADVRLFTTLVRFDAVYHGHFAYERQRRQHRHGRSHQPTRPQPSTPNHGVPPTDQNPRHSNGSLLAPVAGYRKPPGIECGASHPCGAPDCMPSANSKAEVKAFRQPRRAAGSTGSCCRSRPDRCRPAARAPVLRLRPVRTVRWRKGRPGVVEVRASRGAVGARPSRP